MREPRWLAHAWAHLGQKEIPGPRHNDKIQQFFKDAGHPQIKRDETAWCAAFVGACLERSGLKSTRSLMARSYMTWGIDARALKNPIGAVAILSRGSNPALGHVGFLVGQSPGRIWLLGGNQSDAVTVTSYQKSRLLAVRWAGDPDTSLAVRATQSELFSSALKHVLEMEGGYTNDPNDPGGPTNKGITLAVFAAWRNTPLTASTRSKLLADLKSIADEDVRKIYETRYWQRARCADFPEAIALMHFDAAVNHGVKTAIRMLQEAVGTDVDGEVGPLTRSAARDRPVAKTLEAYATTRRARYRSLRHFWRFGRGWLRRVDVTLGRARAILNGDSQNEIQSGNQKSGTHQKRSNGMLVSNDSFNGGTTKWWGQSVTIWGALVTAAATVVPVLGPLTGLEISPDVVRQVGAETFSAAQAIIGLAGTAMAIFGRLRAQTRLVQRSVNFQL